jgi:hypothetical protein
VTRVIRSPWMAIACLALLGLGAWTAWLAAGDSIRLSHDIPGDSLPITLYADEITSWVDGGQRVFLFKGTALVEQGVVHVTMQQGAAWVDLQRGHRTGIAHLELFAEGDVKLEDGARREAGRTGFVELNTRGEVRIKSQKQKVVQQPRPEDVFYQRALVERARLRATPPATDLQPAGGIPPRSPGPNPNNGTPAALAPYKARGVAQDPPAPPPAGAVPPGAGPTQALPPFVPPDTPPDAPRPPPGPGPTAAVGPPRPGQVAPLREFHLAPRTSAPFQVDTRTMPNGEQALFITGGVILTIRDVSGQNMLDIEADRAVIWSRGNLGQLFGNLRSQEGEKTREAEFYLSGNVELRSRTGREERILRASEVYYDVGRNVAVAHDADMEFKQPGLPDPVHFRADEFLQLSATQFKGLRAEIFSSRLPSDPGLAIYVSEGRLDVQDRPKTNILGMTKINPATGQAELDHQQIFHGDNVFIEAEGYPFFYLPYIQGDINDPLGPLENINYKVDRVFGNQFSAQFNVYDLLGIEPDPGTRWKATTNYFDKRGPSLGTEYDYSGKEIFGVPGNYTGLVKAFGINDTGTDILGGDRGVGDDHPKWRGRFLDRHIQELPEDFTVELQLSALSDKNFLEQYYKDEFDRDINQETFIYVKQQRDDWAWTVLTEPRIRTWVTETEWLPKADGYLIGQSFFDRLTYNVHASAGYGRLLLPEEPPPEIGVTNQQDNTGRFDLMQELSYPFYLGPFKMVPYAVLDLTYYTNDLAGQDRGRVYEAGGLRTSIPFTRLYPDVESQLFNINGINHKIVASTNLYIAHSDTPFTLLPQLDRLNDDATDQAIRDITPQQTLFNPTHGLALQTDPLFDPQLYAIRQLVDNRVDTLDSVEELQMDLRQRLQTKRGYPGMQHIVDWMTLDLSATYFPRDDRDNFGENFAFLQYDYTWNVGDRTTLVSTGWVDPIENGPRVFTIGGFLNRPDRTSFYLGYRDIFPLQSRAVSAAATYVFSPKYAMTASSTYDFGTGQALSNSLVFTRMGSDLQVSMGINYNAITNNFGFVFEVYPNLVPEAHRTYGLPPVASGR